MSDWDRKHSPLSYEASLRRSATDPSLRPEGPEAAEATEPPGLTVPGPPQYVDAPHLEMREDESYDLIGADAAADLMVEVHNLHMVFARGLREPVHALRGVNLSVERGSVMGLLGPNGCGKTTTLSCLLGLLNPQSGAIEIDGDPVGDIGLDPSQRRYGTVLEDTRLPPFLTVRESLELVCTMCRLKGIDWKYEFDRVSQECAITGLFDRQINELSKGQARRVGLAAALIGDPPLLVLDEPSSGLDVAARVEFDEILRKLHNGKRTVIIASHFLGDVQNTCTHVAVMRDGRMMVAGSTETLLDLTEADENGRHRSNIFVEERFLPILAREGIACTTCHYAGLVQILTERPDEISIPLLVAAGVVPRRVEPRVNLISVYMQLIHEEDGEGENQA